VTDPRTGLEDGQRPASAGDARRGPEREARREVLAGDARRGLSGTGREVGHDEAGHLERLIDGLARSQPPRRAPASLEARVLAQIATQPWWRKGFIHWPIPARAAFLVASLGFIKLALAGALWAFDFAASTDISGLHRAGDAVSSTVSLGSLVLEAIPSVWLYTGAAVGFTLYAVLFGLSTFAYRTLYLQR